MPLLNCLASTCMHNQDEYCAKTDIQVGGATAKTSSETCCDSFKEQRDGVASNCEHCGTATAETGVCCKACDCDYNENEKCHAGKIGIAGSGASTSSQTQCSTYKCGCK